jgi:Holliday junction DNA helicase RuvB
MTTVNTSGPSPGAAKPALLRASCISRARLRAASSMTMARVYPSGDYAAAGNAASAIDPAPGASSRRRVISIRSPPAFCAPTIASRAHGRYGKRMTVRAVAPAEAPGDPDAALRPRRLAEFIGQGEARALLQVALDAARTRGEAIDHVLLLGPPGLGKTTLAQIIAAELGVGLRQTAGPVIARPGDLAALLTNLEPRDVLFIDEIHRLSPAVEEILYPAMEDRALDILIGEGPAARTVRITLPPFTLVGATTRAGLLATPFRDRFGLPVRLRFYTPDELLEVVARAARLLDLALAPEAARLLAERARGTPRVAGRLLKRVRDLATVRGAAVASPALVEETLGLLGVDAAGLDVLDRRYLAMIAESYGGGPVGVEALAAGLAEPRDTLEDVIEPFLIQQGFVARTARGRALLPAGWRHIGIAPPRDAGQLPLD